MNFPYRTGVEAQFDTTELIADEPLFYGLCSSIRLPLGKQGAAVLIGITSDQAVLAVHLLAKLRGAPLGPDDKELARREAEIDVGTAEFITFDELRKAVGR